MTVIVSELSGGSVVQSLALQVADVARAPRIRAAVGGRYVLSGAENGVAADGIIVKRMGKNLLLTEESEGSAREALIIEDFFVNQGQMFGLGADGKYQPYVAETGEAVPSASNEGVEALLQLASTPTTAVPASALFGVDGAALLSVNALESAPQLVLASAVSELEPVSVVAMNPVIAEAVADPEPAIAAVAIAPASELVPVNSDVLAEPITTIDAPHVSEASATLGREVAEVAAVVVTSAAPAEAIIDTMLDDQGAIQGNIQNGGFTDDGRPQIVGKAESGVLVHVYNGAELIGRAVAGANGEWSFVPRLPLADGRHVISVMYEYLDGDVSDISAPYVIIVDKIAPDVPVISGMTDDQGRIQGQIGNGTITDDNKPTIDGSAEPNATVIIYDKGVEVGRAPVGADGKWSYTPNVALEDGLHILDYAVVDRAGNLGEKSHATQFLIDTRPELVEIYAAEDDAGVVKGNFMSGGVTDDTQPRLFGTATAGGTVKIYEGSVLLGQVTAGVDGKWEFTPTTGLSEGGHSLSATVSTEAKGESDRSATFDFTIDITAPDKPVIEQVYDDKGWLQSALSQGQSTDDTTPTLSGKAEAGSTVRIYDSGNLLGSTVADAAGNWSFTPNPALLDGDHLFTVTAQDKAGSTSVESNGFAITIDTVPPAAPVIELVFDDQGSQTGYLNSGDLTDDSKPTISGTAEAFAKVVIRDHGLEIGHAMADSEGKWSFEPFLPMGLGPHKLTAEAIDAAGNTSELSNRFDLTLGSADRPAVPAITSVVDDVGSVSGNLQKNDVTDDARPTINGTAQAGMTVSVYIDGKLVGSTLVGANGEWSVTPTTDLLDGEHSITAKATNGVGNVSDPTGPYPIVVDTTPPVEPVLADAALWDDAGQITGQISNGAVTDDNTPTFVGKAEPNATVVVYDGQKLIGRVPTNSSGDWSFTPSPVLADGEHAFAYEVVDKAGNVGPKSPVITFEVDTKKVVVAIDGATDDAGAIKGEIGKGGVTDDTTPALHGQATAGGTVKVYEGNMLLGQTVAGSDGKWSFTPAVGLGEGSHSLTATVTTAANGESAKSEVFDFTIDLTGPSKPTIDQIHDDVGPLQSALSQGQSTDDTTPTLSGRAEAGSTVRIYDADNLLGTVVADPAGNWNFTPSPPLLNGAHEFTVTAEDKAGNLSMKSDAFGIVIDTVAPDAPVIVTVYDDQGNQVGYLKTGDATDDTKPTLEGTAEPNSTVVIKDNGHEIGRTTVGADGKWKLEPVLPMGLGDHKLTAESIDAAGNISSPSNPFELVVGSPDQPAQPAITSVVDDVGSITGNIQKDGVTDDARPTINGTAQAGMTVSVYIDEVLAGTTVANANGDWSFTPAADLVDGQHKINATATNVLGNISPMTGDYPIVVDTTPPLPPVSADAALWDDAGTITGAITSGTTTDDNTPTFNGTAEPNATVIIYDDGEEIGRVTSNASGAWTFTPSSVLIDGQHKLNYEVVDKAGNVGPKSEVIDFVVDTSALEVTIDGAIDDAGKITGAISKGGVTDDTTPTLHGKATAGGIVKIYEGDILIGQVVAGSDKKWSFTPQVGLGSGLHSLTATVTTVANGESERSSEFDFSIDVTAPDTPTIVKVVDDVGELQGVLQKGQSTDDTTPTLSGKAEAGSTVYVYDKGSLLGSAVAGETGDWSFTPSPPLLNGAHEFTVKAEDKAGNMSQPSDLFDIVIDTVAPDKPVIDSVYDDHGARTGNVASGGITDDAKPSISGRAEAGSTVIIKDGDVELGRVVAGTDGKWTFELSVALSDGAHELSAEAVDAAGNLSSPSDSFEFAVDTSLPTVPKITNVRDDVGSYIGILQNGGSTDDSKPTINGNGKVGELIEIRSGDLLLGTTVVGENGRWSFTPETALTEGVHSFSAVAISSGGAESAASNSYAVLVDTVAPDRPIIDAVQDNAGTWTGDLQNGETTDDRTPTFVGRAEPNSTIMVFNGGEEVGFATVGDDGAWTYAAERLGYGEHRFTFHAFDVAGNLSEASVEWVVVVAMASRSMPVDLGAEMPVQANDLLVESHAELFAQAAAKRDTAVDLEAVADLQSSVEEGPQESWAVGGNYIADGNNWSSVSPVATACLLEQQLVG